jgi:hypothetical protein
MLTYPLRAYVRHAKLYGGYDSVFEEAAEDLNPLDLARLCMAMRSMSHELHSLRSDGKRKTVVERFKLGTPEREALVRALIRQGEKTTSIVDLVGCSQSHVYKLAQDAEMGSESPEAGAESYTGERPLVVACPASVEA